MRGDPFYPGLRVGLMGGSFNPAHEGHRTIALEALKRLQLDYVAWLVARQNPLKPAEGMAPFAQRLASARAQARHPRLHVSTYEHTRNIQYTADSIAQLRRRHPKTRFVYILGADNFVQLPAWRRWVRLMQDVPIAVFARPDWHLLAATSKPARRFGRRRLPMQAAARLARTPAPAWVLLMQTQLDISSTQLRAAGDWPPPQG